MRLLRFSVFGFLAVLGIRAFAVLVAPTGDSVCSPIILWRAFRAGMFAAMLRKLVYPQRRGSMHCTGKGGDIGNEYMMENALSMLRRLTTYYLLCTETSDFVTPSI